MILYNVTITIDSGIEEEWLQWMKEKHIPDVMKTGMFTDSRICRLLNQPKEGDSTYVIKYACAGKENYKRYLEEFAPALREEFNQRYKDKFVADRRVMEVLE